MRLRIVIATRIVVDTEVRRVLAETEGGAFCILPRHIDMASALRPGILSYVTADDTEEAAAIDEGLLVKCGPDVWVTAGQAVAGQPLGALRQAVEKAFEMEDEREQLARSAIARLEIDMVRRFLELGQQR